MTSKTLSDGPWHERYPLHHGAKEGNLAQVKLYVEVKHFSPDEADGEYLKTPLMFAALERRFDVAQFLLQRSDVHVSKCTRYICRTHWCLNRTLSGEDAR